MTTIGLFSKQGLKQGIGIDIAISQPFMVLESGDVGHIVSAI